MCYIDYGRRKGTANSIIKSNSDYSTHINLSLFVPLRHALLSYDGTNQFRRRHVETGIVDIFRAHAWWCQLHDLLFYDGGVVTSTLLDGVDCSSDEAGLLPWPLLDRNAVNGMGQNKASGSEGKSGWNALATVWNVIVNR